MVEHAIENRSVGGSIPPLGTTLRPYGLRGGATQDHGEACPAKLEQSESEDGFFDSASGPKGEAGWFDSAPAISTSCKFGPDGFDRLILERAEHLAQFNHDGIGERGVTERVGVERAA